MNSLTASKERSTDWNPSLSDSKAQAFHRKEEEVGMQLGMLAREQFGWSTIVQVEME